MTTDLTYLLDVSSSLTRQEAIMRWRAYFASHGHSELFDQILAGDDIDLPFDMERAARIVANRAMAVSSDARLFIQATLLPENIGKTTEALCKELKINAADIIEESSTEAYREYVRSIRESDISHLIFHFKKAALTQLTTYILEKPANGLAAFESMAQNDKALEILGLLAEHSKAINGGSLEIQALPCEYEPPAPPVIDIDPDEDNEDDR